MRDFYINLIRKAAIELLDAIESYHQQLIDAPDQGMRLQLVELARWLAERLRDVVLEIQNSDPDSNEG